MGKRYYLGEAGVRKLRALMNGRGESGAVRGSVPGLALEDEFAHPFTVQWAASAGESGAWLIWLPVAEELLTVDGERVDPSADLEPAGGDYPEGWFRLSGVESSGGQVWLNVSRADEGESEEDAIAVEFADEADDDAAFAVLIAETSVSSSGAVSVKQLVCSSLVLSRGANVDNVSVDKNGGESGGKLEIAHFKDGEKDSGTGLDSLLRADPETGEISAEGADGIMLVARRDGEVVYIPIGGGGEDPDTPGGKGGCDDHPGGGDAVDPNAGGGGGGAVHVVDDGGVVPVGGGFPDGGRTSCCD